MFAGSISPSMSFSEAVTFYLNWRSAAPALPGRRQERFVGARTLKDYKQKAKALEKFFGEMKLENIKAENFTGYQEARLNADGYTRFYGDREVSSPAGGIKINSELALLKRLMVMAQCWTPTHQLYYEPFQQQDPDEQKALSPDEQETFLRSAASRPRWYPIWWYALVATHLTFSSDEMRTIRLGGINEVSQIVSVNPRYGKNATRRRNVTVEDPACMWALQRLKERAAELGATATKYKGPQPHYFLFPRRVVKNLYDPELPMGETGLRKLFEEVREHAGVPWFNFNAFRHTGATRLAEAGISPYILEERMGHVGQKMMKRYVQIGQQAQRMAVRNAVQKRPVVSIREGDTMRKVRGF